MGGRCLTRFYRTHFKNIMVVSSLDIDFKTLIRFLKDDEERVYNLEFKRRIVANSPQCVEYYLGDFSKETVRYIQDKIIHRDILTEFYEHLSAPLGEDGRPVWHKVSLYNAKNGCTLSTYTSRITVRHFTKVANRERKRALKDSPLLEYVDYQALLDYAQDSDDDSIERMKMKKRIRAAFNSLEERDRHVIISLVINKKHWSTAFRELYDYIHPKPAKGMTSDEVKASWTNKQKQDAMSLLKGRALCRLQEAFFQQ